MLNCAVVYNNVFLSMLSIKPLPACIVSYILIVEVTKYLRRKFVIIKWCPIICLKHLLIIINESVVPLYGTLYCVLVFSVIGDCKADIVFIMDSSANIGSMNWFFMKQTVIDMVQGLKVE